MDLTKENIERIANKIKEIDLTLQEVKRDNLNPYLEHRMALIGEELRLLYFEIKGFDKSLKTIKDNVEYFKQLVEDWRKNDNN